MSQKTYKNILIKEIWLKLSECKKFSKIDLNARRLKTRYHPWKWPPNKKKMCAMNNNKYDFPLLFVIRGDLRYFFLSPSFTFLHPFSSFPNQLIKFELAPLSVFI